MSDKVFKDYAYLQSLIDDLIYDLRLKIDSCDADISWLGIPEHYEELVHFEYNHPYVEIHTQYQDEWDSFMDKESIFNIPVEWFDMDTDQLHALLALQSKQKELEHYQSEYKNTSKNLEYIEVSLKELEKEYENLTNIGHS